jgi:hypothetical protein
MVPLRVEDIVAVSRRIHERRGDLGRGDIVAPVVRADVLASQVETVAASDELVVHIAARRIGNRVIEIVAITHILAPPTGNRVKNAVIRQSRETGGGALLVGQAQELVLIAGREGIAVPGQDDADRSK